MSGKKTKIIQCENCFRFKPLYLKKCFHCQYSLVKEWRELLSERQNHRCCYCGLRTNEYPDVHETHHARVTLEHVVPKSADGKDVLDNLVMACYGCNNQRSSTPLGCWLVLVESKNINRFHSPRKINRSERKREQAIAKAKRKMKNSLKRYFDLLPPLSLVFWKHDEDTRRKQLDQLVDALTRKRASPTGRSQPVWGGTYKLPGSGGSVGADGLDPCAPHTLGSIRWVKRV